MPDGQIRGLQQVIDQAESPFSAAHMDVYHAGFSGGQGPQPHLTGHMDELLKRGVAAPVVRQRHLDAQNL